LTFTLSDGSTVVKTEAFSGVTSTTTRDVTYDIGCYKVTVRITVTTTGTNNNMIITGATATITEAELNPDVHGG